MSTVYTPGSFSILAKPTYTKHELKKLLKPGVFVTLAWNDWPDQTVMLVSKPNMNEKGDVSLHYMAVNKEGHPIIDSHAIHSQIVGVNQYTKLVFPDPARDKACV